MAVDVWGYDKNSDGVLLSELGKALQNGNLHIFVGSFFPGSSLLTTLFMVGD